MFDGFVIYSMPLNHKRISFVETGNLYSLANVFRLTFFFNCTQISAVSAKNIVLHNIIHDCTRNPTFSFVMQLVHSSHPGAMNGPVAKFNNVFLSSNSCR